MNISVKHYFLHLSEELLKTEWSGENGLKKEAVPQEVSTGADYRRSGASGTGQVLSNTLEMSNVSIAEEFVEMIISQRGHQANSRIVSTSNDLIAEPVNLTRRESLKS